MERISVPLPAPLRGSPPFAFVGRRAELATLADARRRAEEVRQVVLVAGEPGAGKSRLVREFARRAADDGDIVLYGMSDPSTMVSYQPITESLGHLFDHLTTEQLADVVGPTGGELLRLFPDLLRRLEGMVAPIAATAETEQHRLHTALRGLLANVALHGRVLLVLDDLHWADRATLSLLRHLLRTAGTTELVLVLTFRSTEADVLPPLADLLADLARVDGIVRVELGGLDGTAIGELLDELGGVEPQPARDDLVTALRELTAGNAFLLGEVWRHLVETGAVTSVDGTWRVAAPVREQSSPDRVREVVAQRLARLTPTTRTLLEAAAIVGPESDLRLLRAVLDADESALVSALEEAVASGTLEPTAGSRPAYRFAHELVRRAVHDRLNPVARARIHLRVAEALERVAEDDGRRLRDLATHYTAAADLGATDKAVTYCLRAAEVAHRQLAFDETAARLADVLDLGVPDADRGGLHLRRGAALRAAGAWRDAIASYRAAADWARGAGDVAMLVSAALGLEDTCWRPGITDAGAAGLLTEAAEAIGPERTTRRVELLAALARAHGFQGDARSATVARRAAVELARHLDDPRALAGALAQSYWGRGDDPTDEVLEAMGEALALAESVGDRELRFYVLAWWVPIMCEAGRLDEIRRGLPSFRDEAERLGQQLFLYHGTQTGAALALADGRIDEAAALADRALDYSRLGGLDAGAAHGIQTFAIRREQGRLAELAPMARLLTSDEARSAVWRPGLTVLFAELGMGDEARQEIARLCADGFAEVPHDSLRIAALTYLAEACYLVDDTVHAPLVYEQLRPRAGSSLMVAATVVLLGAADRYLGMLAACVGDHGAAARHFEAALALDAELGVVTWPAWTRYLYGRMLLDQGRASDVARANELLDAAERVATRHGLAGLAHRIAALRDATPTTIALPAGLTVREADVLRLVAEGLSNRLIGERLFISPNTAANHVRSILMKTGCTNRTEAATFAHHHGLVDDRGHTRR
jgi:DNA-binding CsgD family transcriptional regulator/tetratricopeptide (TPR) repeat protein